jgi:hypothetical protein
VCVEVFGSRSVGFGTSEYSSWVLCFATSHFFDWPGAVRCLATTRTT